MSNIMSPAEERLERSFRHVRIWSVLLCLAAIACLLVAGFLASVVGAVFVEEERQATVALISVSVGAGVGALAVTVVSALSMGGRVPLMLAASLSIVLSAVSAALAAMVAVRGLEGVFGLAVSCGVIAAIAVTALGLAIFLILANGSKKRLLAAGAMPYSGYGDEGGEREGAPSAYAAGYGDGYDDPYAQTGAYGAAAYGAGAYGAGGDAVAPVAASSYAAAWPEPTRGAEPYAAAPAVPAAPAPQPAAWAPTSPAAAPAVDAAETRAWSPSAAPQPPVVREQPARVPAAQVPADPFAFIPDAGPFGALGSIDAFDLDDGDDEWAPVVAVNRRAADDEDDWSF